MFLSNSSVTKYVKVSRLYRRENMVLENPNVFLYLIAIFVGSLGWSVWGYTLLSNIIYIITDSTWKIGLSEGVQGALSGLLALPFGILADKWNKQHVSRMGLVIRILASCCLSAILTVTSFISMDTDMIYWFLFGSLAFYGISEGVGTAATSTLFTNSIPTGSRSKWMTVNQIVSSLGLAFGSVIAIVILEVKGNNWILSDMIIPWNVALGLNILSCLILFGMKNERCLKDETMGNISKKIPDSSYWCFKTKHIPYICMFVDCIFGFSSGMTIKFFPIFFQDKVFYNPVDLQILFAVGFCTIALFTFFAKKVADKFGRVQTCILFPYVGLVFLLVIVVGKDKYWDNKWLIGICYIIRSACMNATSALHGSIVDDYVDSEKRGCWNSLEFVFVLGWSGSAVLGGILVQLIDYQYTFMITLIAQFVSTSLYWFLIPLVPKKEHSLVDAEEEKSLLVN